MRLPTPAPVSIVLEASSVMLDRLRRDWPPADPADHRGYRPLSLTGTEPVAVVDLGRDRAVVVVAHPGGLRSALPCRRSGDRWQVAVAGDGLAAALLALGSGAAPGPGSAGTASPHLELVRLVRPWPASHHERELGTDQSNRSVVVDEQRLVKWRTSLDGSGDRGIRLRRHLALTDFVATPPLEGYLVWSDEVGKRQLLADVDTFLPGAEDGWEHLMPALAALVESGTATRNVATGLGATLGSLAAELHLALAAPSEVIPTPLREATPQQLVAVRDAGLAAIGEAVAIEAEDQPEVVTRETRLRAVITQVPADRTPLQPIHGDLHIGQIVVWRGGLAVIDFDGPPAQTEPVGAEGCAARDVAQLALSLWNLAAAVAARTEDNHVGALQAWAASAEADLVRAYRATTSRLGRPHLLDERLLEPFVAEHVCRELIYAERTLPRWRYAPMQALRWRYPLES